MDGNNWRPAAPGGEAAMDGGDWRATLQADSRQRIVNKIMETLKRHLPFSGQEGLQELKKIAVRFEEKIYTAANSQSDYLRKISLKMLTMESKSQNSIPNSLPPNSAGNGSKPPDPGASPSMQSQVPSQRQSLPIPLPANQPQARQQLLTQNMQNNMNSTGLQSSANLQSSLPPVSGMNQTPINVPGQNAGMQNMSNIAQNPVGTSIGQGVLLNMFGNTHRQMPGRNQFFGQQQQQQLQNPQQYLYKQQQFQQQLLLNQRNLAHPMMQSQLQQQQQQNGLQSSQFQQPLQFGMQTPSVMQPSVMQSPNFAAQTGQENGDDWQEEIYQKIKAKREMYLPELNEMLIKVVSKLEQHDSLPQLPKSDQLEKLKKLKTMLEGMINSLQVHKENVIPILSFKNLPNKPMPAMQQPPSQNPQLQPMNMQSSVSAMQQNNMSNMQHGLSGVQMMYSLQPQGNAVIPPLLGKVVSVPDDAAHGSSKAFTSVTGKSGVAEHDQPLEELIKAAGDVWNPIPLHHFAAMIFFFLCFFFFVFGQWGQCS